MIAEIGQYSLVLALFTAIILAVFPILGAQTNRPQLNAIARPASWGLFVWVAISFICLTITFIENDFSVLYVAQNSNSQLPLIYRICAVWGGHEGSILLWALMLAGWTLAVAVFSKHLPDKMVARILGILGILSIGVLLFTLLTSNPFDRLFPPAPEGRDLNPLLQDPGMIIHPPFLYMGYVGSAVAFAFAIAALLSGRLDAAWARWSRPWVTTAWCFLTIGIALGSAWAYYELGWGGWWFWDPVENASFMPWLVGTALIHSLAVTEKRGGFKMWTALLAILDDEIVGEEARKVYADAQAMLEKLIKGQWLQADAIVGLFPANSQGDDILLYPDESRSKPFLIWHNLRQQSERPVVDGVKRPNRCLADYVANHVSGIDDYVGCFAVTTGHGVEEKAAQFLAKHDDYSAIMLKALADRLAEAFAELMHWRVRTDLWGYAAGEKLSTEELIDEKYQGIRPAPGYPACPDHQVKFAMFHAMKADEIGMTLTESLAMNPASSVSGFYLANPNAMYFNVGKVSSDQVGDFARRTGKSPEEVRRSLASLLD